LQSKMEQLSALKFTLCTHCTVKCFIRFVMLLVMIVIILSQILHLVANIAVSDSKFICYVSLAFSALHNPIMSL